ncbi:bacterial NAD-glutamate dehydrogenase family protein [Ochrobactrum quorumnocens]|uniref:Bacterial NAD-glutamate dehydrogenase family protein n=1 Tax=Ochrobactrum quorumnocens TaxID=271865 RepID=A0A248ULW7_9HYPH|nr:MULTISPECIES: NAD-glutamate dehydrogenase [Brucella/Ochrobactrum group]ASV87622.1 bacterial NAD-glutamate dehydrogenase family protein [[Ochrobactrum] quorumnocens]MBD7991560.1 NAD-glutamate dehydrogenase [Ochrobactrum gallinarum]
MTAKQDRSSKIKGSKASKEERKGGKSKALTAFSQLLFEWAPPEDLAAYDAAALDKSAQYGYEALQSYRKGKSIISVDNSIERHGRPVSVITIVNDNMPFLLDSIMGELNDHVSQIFMVVHPVFDIEREKDDLTILGEASQLAPAKGVERVSLVQIHLPALDKQAKANLTAAIKRVLGQVRSAVSDWKPMMKRLDGAIADYKRVQELTGNAAMPEAIAFLEWLRDDRFIFLGMRELTFKGKGDNRELVPVKETLGILNDSEVRILRKDDDDTVTPREITDFLDSNEPLIVTKANSLSLVHRRSYLDYVGVKIFGPKGEAIGELRLVGLFTSVAYTSSVAGIPFIRSKADAVIKHLGFNREDHSGKALINVLEEYPRDELFQIDTESLTANAELILALGERPRVRAVPRLDRFGRFATVLVYIPRDRYDSVVREKIGRYLVEIYSGDSFEFHPVFLQNGLTRVQFVIRRHERSTPHVDREELEAEVRAIVRTWEDAVRESSDSADAKTVALAASFPQSYREIFTAPEALIDAERIAGLSAEAPLFVDFYRYRTDGPDAVSLKLYHHGAPVVLSQRVPLLENMGFRVVSEQTIDLPQAGKDSAPVYVHDMQLVNAYGAPVDLSDDGEMLEDVFRNVWDGLADNDGYNALVQTARLTARQIMILRSYGRYLQQAGIAYSQGFIAAALNRYPEIASDLYSLFDLRFNPSAKRRESAEKKLVDGIETALLGVPSIDDDQILRRFRNLIEATLRTNAYQPDGEGKPRVTFAFKLNPRLVEGLPDPRPYREIFVYGPEVEGVHLRFGAVARGGLRWSDRAQDYRTEVLGLVKAQQVKNAVIVPVGAKGGFYPKRLPVGGDRNAVFEAGRDAYKVFISTLLSVTDNIHDNDVVPPAEVVRHDNDDPYFVVAADKGTATFSDTANAISQAHDFWLDDAFASGGSAGYDHKGMAITARGAWEAVKRHFREFDKDIQTEPFTVAGVGDMSGDVFGNGMLLSEQIRLVAAFDHRDIFIDPDPVPADGFAERKRLFDLPRSSWQDYDRSKLSAGGGVYSRSQKTITLSAEAAKAIGLSKTTASPQEIMTTILKAQVDLLWFGGIGTYIRSTAETDAQVGDRANDAIRITGSEVRARVIGEGANLGVTQRGRIEYALTGGRSNTDAIDNSAGVNCSDVEVNIKIALAAAMRSGKLKRPARDKLLVSMTDEVSELVLRNNYLQPLALSLSERQGLTELPYQARFMAELETRKLLDRKVEYLPSDALLNERQKSGQPLTRPELAVLLAYAKLSLSDDLVASRLPDEPYFDQLLFGYFPKRMVKNYAEEISNHRLKREIVATLLANDVINRGGITFISRLADTTGKSAADIVRAYVAVRDGFEINAIYDAIDALDNKVTGDVQNQFYHLVGEMLLSTTAWVLRNDTTRANLTELVNTITTARAALEPRFDGLMPDYLIEAVQADKAAFVEKGAPEKLAQRLANLQLAGIMPDIALIAHLASADLVATAKTYFGVSEAFRIGRIEEAARTIPVTDYYDGLALSRASDTITQAARGITIAALKKHGKDKDPAATWFAEDAARIDQVKNRMVALTEGGDLTVSRLAVAAGLMSDLTQ